MKISTKQVIEVSDMIFIDSIIISHKRDEKRAEIMRKIAANFEIVKVPFGQTGNNILYLRKKL